MKQIIVTFLLTTSLMGVGAFFHYEKQLESTHKTVSILQEEQEKQSAEIAKLENVIEKQNSELEAKEDSISELKSELENSNGKVQRLQDELQKYDSLRQLDVVATAYQPLCKSGCTGITATGHDVRNTVYKDGYRVVAVDPRVVPLGSLLHVETEDRSFVGIAEDTGGAIKGRKIDVLVRNESRAYTFGKQDATITVLREGRS
jgi:3D (Asp-Asp-Asp) domain-containing protein